MTIPFSLAETVALAFEQALREQNFGVAELMLQALEHLNAECRCEAVELEEALLAIGDQSQHTPRSKRLVH